MRRVTRNAVVALAVIVGLVLALGAVPGLLKTGDPYYVTAERVDEGDLPADARAVNGTGLSEERFPYTTTALEESRSDPYWKGYVGVKEAFTHSPFDEVSALEGRAALAGNGSTGSGNSTVSNASTASSDTATSDDTATTNGSELPDDHVLVRYNGTFYSVAVEQRP